MRLGTGTILNLQVTNLNPTLVHEVVVKDFEEGVDHGVGVPGEGVVPEGNCNVTSVLAKYHLSNLGIKWWTASSSNKHKAPSGPKVLQ